MQTQHTEISNKNPQNRYSNFCNIRTKRKNCHQNRLSTSIGGKQSATKQIIKQEKQNNQRTTPVF